MSGPAGERRCRTCDALLSEDASWCGQCFSPVVEEPEPVLEPVTAPIPPPPSPTEPAPLAHWPCTLCGGQNPIELEACATCGTPFADLMRETKERPHVAPNDALVWSLVFPGLGHRKLGLPLDGLVRSILFTVALAMVVLLAFGGVGSAPTIAVFGLFVLMGLVVYGASAYEAYHLAQGGRVLISPRTLLWVLVGVIVASVGLLAFAVMSAPRR